MDKIIDMFLSIFDVLISIYRAGNSMMDKLPFLKGGVAKNVVWICALAICYHFIFVESNSPDSPVRRYCDALAAGDYEKAVDQCIYGGDTSGDDRGKEDRRIRAMMLSYVYDQRFCKAFGSYRIVGVDSAKVENVVIPRVRIVRVELSDGDEKLSFTADVYKCDNGKWKIEKIGNAVRNTVIDQEIKISGEKFSDVEGQDSGSKPKRKSEEPLWLKMLNWIAEAFKLIFVLGLVGGGLMKLCQWLKRRS